MDEKKKSFSMPEMILDGQITDKVDYGRKGCYQSEESVVCEWRSIHLGRLIKGSRYKKQKKGLGFIY